MPKYVFSRLLIYRYYIYLKCFFFCTECDQCPNSAFMCDEETGRCICPPLSRGSDCQQCYPNSWGWEHRKGCTVLAKCIIYHYLLFYILFFLSYSHAVVINRELLDKHVISTRVIVYAVKVTQADDVMFVRQVIMGIRAVSDVIVILLVRFTIGKELFCAMILVNVRVNHLLPV